MVTRPQRNVRASERGAALFVVVLVLTLLTAVGLFAAQSATLVDQASGYSRQAAQTAYLAELGVVAATAEVGSGAASVYHAQMLTGGHKCTMNDGMNPSEAGNPPCYVLELADFASPSGKPLIDTSTMSLTPTFRVELTDPGPAGAPIAGMDAGGTGPASFEYKKITATAIAQIRPSADVACVESVATVTGQQMMRAHVIVGPVPK